MQIKSPMFGSAEIAEDKIIEFPMGLPGFSEFELWQTSEATIRKARNVLDTL